MFFKRLGYFLNKIAFFVRFSLPRFFRHPLWSKYPLLPFVRFLKLQLIFILGAKSVSLPWFKGLILPIERGDNGLTGNFYFGLHEFEDMAFATHVLRCHDLFIDVGSNLGSYSLLASGVSGAFSIAYEPVPATYSKLVANVSLNNLSDRIEPRMVALTSPQISAHSVPLFSADQGCTNSLLTIIIKVLS